MKKFAFYVSNNGTRLKRFLTIYKEYKFINQIDFILIDNVNNTELKEICHKLNINCYEVDLEKEKKKNLIISDIFLEYLNKHTIDLAFIFADRILVGDLLLKYKNKLINFHPSILPSHKGLLAIDQALVNKTFLLGNSAHFVTSELDGGSVLIQNIVHHSFFINYDDLLDRQIIMLIQIMKWFNEERIYFVDDYALVKDADYTIGEYIPKIELITKDK